MADNVLVIGSGAREHALAWKLSQSPAVNHVYVAPGNAGTYTTLNGKFSNCEVNVKDHDEIASWCQANKINLVVVGPEDPLANGLADHLNKVGIQCFGPCQKAAQIEASKDFAKAFMDRHQIPTAQWKSFRDVKEAQGHIINAPYTALVVKASGLAAGKGVIVGKNKGDAVEAVNTLKKDKGLSGASETIIIEELLTGEEVSVLCFSDGSHISVMPPAQDHKRLQDNDQGPMTGGMGAYCRCPLVSDLDMEFIRTNILQRTIDGMAQEGCPYVGVLYAGLMMTKNGPKVLEFNCRFGDPETQVILPLLESDLYQVMLSCVQGTLNKTVLQWSGHKSAVGVVVASGGYPGSYEKGKVITGLDQLTHKHYAVFHAGTSNKSGSLTTSGGRVLTVVAICDSLPDATATALSGAKRVKFEGAFHRTDIAQKGIRKLPSKGMTYAASGVSIESGDALVRKIKGLTEVTLRKEVRGSIGGFGGVFELSDYSDPYLVSKIGNLGEKLKIAQEHKQYELIGHDIVAESVNEILCRGAEPLFFLDTYTCGKLNVDVAAKVITGITSACKEAKCSLVGGETAEMPGMYHEEDFDLASFARGAVEKTDILPRDDVQSGDIAVGLLSTSLNHKSIKYLKQLIDESISEETNSICFGNGTVNNILLSPRDIYVDALLPLMRKGHVKAAVYINEEGLAESVQKVLAPGVALQLDGSKWTIPSIFNRIAEQGKMSKRDMVRDLNLGLDVVLFVEKDKVEEVLSHIKASGKTAACIGTVESSKGQETVELLNMNFTEKPISKKRVAIITSDKGSNVKSLIDFTQNPSNLSAAEIILVISTGDHASLGTAKNNNIQVKALDASKTTEEIEEALTAILKTDKIDIVCLDSVQFEFSKEFLNSWSGKILNIHPALLPSFQCENVHEEVVAFGAKVTGCTVYLLQAEGLNGNIVQQGAINVSTADTEQSLEERVKKLQNAMYPSALELVASGKYNDKNSICKAKIFCGTSKSDFDELHKSVMGYMNSTARAGFKECKNSAANVFDLKAAGYEKPYLISGTDGVGTKLKIAQACNKHDTIGIDLVAMCVNDILTHGAEPLFFLASYDCGLADPATVKSVFSGIAEGCKQADCALIGTEINELPEIYLNPQQGPLELEKYDVVGYAEGALKGEQNLLPLKNKLKAGDRIIGIASSGIHSNGYSLVRKLLKLKNLRYQDPFPLDPTKTLADVLLTPTKIYVKSVLPLIRKGYVKAAAHITGGGLTMNVPRVFTNNLQAVLDGSMWENPPIMKWIASESRVTKAEFLKIFNCGLGMVLVVDKSHEKQALEDLAAANETASTVGFVAVRDPGDIKVIVKNFDHPIVKSRSQMKRVAVLISGSGTNLQALIDYTLNSNNCSHANIVLVLSNVPGVEGLKRAKRAGIHTEILNHKDFRNRVDFDMAMHEVLQFNKVDIVCLAGFMRILSKEFVQLWQGRLLNVHPALLPSFKGMNAHKQVLEMGAQVTGCSVHFVEAEIDAGAVIEQAAVQVEPDDTEKSLQEKVKVLEHKIFPKALELLASGRVSRGSDGKLVWHA